MHLDGRKVVLDKSKVGIISPKKRFLLPGEGMPVPGRAGQRGDMHIQFDVVFPSKRMSCSQMKHVRNAFKNVRFSSHS